MTPTVFCLGFSLGSMSKLVEGMNEAQVIGVEECQSS